MSNQFPIPGVPKTTQIAEQAPNNQRGFLGSVSNLLNNPMLMSLLAQSGYSPTPQSPMGAVGRAFFHTNQFNQGNERADLENRLLKARIGLTEAQTAAGGFNASAGNVQSTFRGKNGNMWVFTRGSTEPVDTGVPFDSNVKTQEMADGSVIAIDADGNSLGYVISPDQARTARTRELETDAAFTLPTDLAGLDTTISQAEATIAKIRDLEGLTDEAGFNVYLRGDLPGAFGGDARALKQEAKSLQANLGFDTLQKMRAASKTGGALGQVSERELDLLISAVQSLDIEGDPERLRQNLQKVITHYENYKREIEIMKNAMREQAGQAPVETTPEDKPKRRRYDTKTGTFS